MIAPGMEVMLTGGHVREVKWASDYLDQCVDFSDTTEWVRGYMQDNLPQAGGAFEVPLTAEFLAAVMGNPDNPYLTRVAQKISYGLTQELNSRISGANIAANIFERGGEYLGRGVRRAQEAVLTTRPVLMMVEWLAQVVKPMVIAKGYSGMVEEIEMLVARGVSSEEFLAEEIVKLWGDEDVPDQYGKLYVDLVLGRLKVWTTAGLSREKIEKYREQMLQVMEEGDLMVLLNGLAQFEVR